MYKMSAAKPLSVELIEKYIEKNRAKDARLEKLHQYYIGNSAIKRRAMADASKPNNRVANPYAHYITDMMTGYFMGEPVKYNSAEEEQLNVISAILNYNDEADNNAQLAKDASIYGAAYELLYLDEDAQIRFKKIDSKGCIPIYENTIESELLYFIRYYDEEDILTGNTTTFVEVYSRSDIKTYEKSIGALRFINEMPHSWGLVPICIYANNEEEIGDFETVISEIDAYDLMESDSINEMNYFADAYLALYGLEGTEAEDVAAMKENRVLVLPVDAKAEWLTKSINDTYIENQKKRLDNNIHKFSYCPRMTDEDFSANASGVAMKYKLMGLENATSKKESAFKRGIQRRLELICNILNVMGNSYDFRAINIVFTRNIPSNIIELADVVNKISGLYSEKTLMDILPIEADYDAEQEQKVKENEARFSLPFTLEINE